MENKNHPLRIFVDVEKGAEHIRNCILEEILWDIKNNEEPAPIDSDRIKDLILHELYTGWASYPLLPRGPIRDAIIAAEAEELYAAVIKDF